MCGERTHTPFLLHAGTEQTLENADTDTTQRQTDTGQHQDGIAGNNFTDISDPTDHSGKHFTNRSQQAGNSNRSSRHFSPFLHFYFQQAPHHDDDRYEADQTEQIENRGCHKEIYNGIQHGHIERDHFLHLITYP